MKMTRQMTRGIFLRRVVQAGLLALLGLIFFSLKNRIVSGNACNGCPEHGTCTGSDNCTR